MSSFTNKHANPPCELEDAAGLVKLFAEITRYFPAADIDENCLAEKAHELIKNNFRDSKCRVDSISYMVGISRSQLFRLFVKKYSVSPKEYIDICRIDYAATLLAEKDMSIGEVCYSCGFNDPLYFSTRFKKEKGMAPSAYKEAHGHNLSE